MSEKRYKRFYVSESENQLIIYDNEGLDDYYHLGNDERDVKGICKLLNEQQATINELQSIINHIKCEENCFDYDYCCETVCSLYNEIKHLKEENEQLKKENIELKKLRKYCAEWMGVKEENLYDVVR